MSQYRLERPPVIPISRYPSTNLSRIQSHRPRVEVRAGIFGSSTCTAAKATTSVGSEGSPVSAVAISAPNNRIQTKSGGRIQRVHRAGGELGTISQSGLCHNE